MAANGKDPRQHDSQRLEYLGKYGPQSEIGLHVIAEEASSSSLNGMSPELGDRWRYGDLRNPVERRRWKVDRKRVHILS